MSSTRHLAIPIGTAILACTLTCTQPAFAREPPAAGCIDLRDLDGGWRSADREILIRASDATGARLALDPACPIFPEGIDLVTLGPGGWACPDKSAWVRGGAITCPVVRMQPLTGDALTDALLDREAELRSSVTLERVVVQGHRWRDIRGETDRCVDARFLRGWREDGDGLVVEVSPKRHSGHRFYRVETVNRCSDLASAHSIRLRSRSGGAAVCGHPGDKVMLLGNASSSGLAAMGAPATHAFERGCEISRVVPLSDE